MTERANCNVIHIEERFVWFCDKKGGELKKTWASSRRFNHNFVTSEHTAVLGRTKHSKCRVFFQFMIEVPTERANCNVNNIEERFVWFLSKRGNNRKRKKTWVNLKWFKTQWKSYSFVGVAESSNIAMATATSVIKLE